MRQHHDTSHDQATRSALLLDVARFMLESVDGPGALAEQVFERVKEHAGAQVMLAHRFARNGSLRMVGSAGVPPELHDAATRQQLAQVLCRTVAQTREPLVTDDACLHCAENEPAAAFLRQLGLRSYACHPLLARDGAVLGTFAIGRHAPTGFIRAEVEFIQTVSHLLALAWDRDRAVRDLRWRERQLKTLVDHTPCILTRYDRQQRYVLVNAQFEQVTGLKAEAVLGQDMCAPDFPPQVCASWRAAVTEVFETGEPTSISFQLPTPKGLRHYESRVVPERAANGAVETAIALTSDRTTEERALQSLREADRRKDEFLATLAHELRNPLAPVRTGLQILRMLLVDKTDTGRTLETMERQVRHMVRLIDDLLDVSRITRGKLELQLERLPLRDVIDSAIEASRPALDAGRHDLRIHLPHEVMYVEADAVRMAQVLANLLNNAAKYTPQGGRIDLVVERPDGEAVIRVIDNGVGIPPEALPHVFEMFTQVDKNLQRAQGGLGIGLSIVRKLVEMHGGRIEVESPGLGQGAQFTVRLPLAREAVPVPPAPHEQSPPALPRRRVLVVDGDADSAEGLATMLTVLGHESRTAQTRAEAIELADEFSPEVIVCQLATPPTAAWSGWDLARELREVAGSNATLVALTDRSPDKQRILASGFDQYLVQPVEIGELRRLMFDRRRRRALH